MPVLYRKGKYSRKFQQDLLTVFNLQQKPYYKLHALNIFIQELTQAKNIEQASNVKTVFTFIVLMPYSISSRSARQASSSSSTSCATQLTHVDNSSLIFELLSQVLKLGGANSWPSSVGMYAYIGNTTPSPPPQRGHQWPSFGKEKYEKGSKKKAENLNTKEKRKARGKTEIKRECKWGKNEGKSGA